MSVRDSFSQEVERTLSLVMYVTGLLPSYIAAFDPLAGTPPVYQIIDGMTFTDWSCYRYVSLSYLFTGCREDSMNCYTCG